MTRKNLRKFTATSVLLCYFGHAFAPQIVQNQHYRKPQIHNPKCMYRLVFPPVKIPVQQTLPQQRRAPSIRYSQMYMSRIQNRGETSSTEPVLSVNKRDSNSTNINEGELVKGDEQMTLGNKKDEEKDGPFYSIFSQNNDQPRKRKPEEKGAPIEVSQAEERSKKSRSKRRLLFWRKDEPQEQNTKKASSSNGKQEAKWFFNTYRKKKKQSKDGEQQKVVDITADGVPEKIAHVALEGQKSPGILFCNGFRSSMEGQKALALELYCRNAKRSFTRFDYRGHGMSSGQFTDFVLSDWIQDTLEVLDNVTKGPQILVGSSMGAWIALHVALARPKRVAGIVGVASAPDFILDVYSGLSVGDKQKLEQNGIVYLASRYSDEHYPITRQLVEDSRAWSLLTPRSIPITCPVRLLHGQQDEDVPFQKSLGLAQALKSDDVEVTLIKNGNHRLSRPHELKRLTSIVNELTLELEYSE